MTTSPRIVLRTKFANNVPDSVKEIFFETYRDLENKNPDTIKKILWKITYNPAKHLPYFGLIPENAINGETLTNSKESSDTSSNNTLIPISSTQIKLFVNELLSHFKKKYPDILKISIPESCKDSFKKLSSSVDNNEIIAYTVYERCLYHLYNSSNQIERTIALLNSTDDKQYFGGIRSISFNRDESALLKPYYSEIHNLLQDMFKESLEPKTEIYSSMKASHNCVVSISAASIISKPTIKKSKNIDNDEPAIDCLIVKPAEKITETKPEPIFKAITSENILANINLFKSIQNDLNILSEFNKLGFNLNEIIEKKDSIITLLKAYDALNT